METFKTMTCRKSVRSYKSTLSDANLQKILMAAQAAPIGMGAYDRYPQYRIITGIRPQCC